MRGWMLAVVATLLWPTGSLAQEPTVLDVDARARELFEEGLAQADRGDWDRAVHRFRAALEVRASASIRFNLAHSLARMGRVVEALEELDRVRADPATMPDVQHLAHELDARIRPRLGVLRVEVRGDLGGAHVTIDGRPLAPELVGEPVPSDAGMRVLRLLRGGEQLDVEEAEVPARGHATVILETPTVSGDDGWVWGTVIGAVVVAIASGVVLALVATGDGGGDFTPGVLVID